ncbi:MAG: polysaccharide deacetylase family protein [Oscillospiraceae bacterium]|nr:polysaccharide deacetylase family protein [Oscillospiraceae bacterium]
MLTQKIRLRLAIILCVASIAVFITTYLGIGRDGHGPGGLPSQADGAGRAHLIASGGGDGPGHGADQADAAAALGAEGGSGQTAGGPETVTVADDALPYAGPPYGARSAPKAMYIADVSFRQASEAEAILSSQGFRTVRVQSFSEAAPVGAVLTVTPPSGSHAEVGSTIVLGVNGGVRQTPYVPVGDILGLPSTVTVGASLTLRGDVVPASSTSKAITWVMVNSGGTGAVIAGDRLTAKAAGTAVVRAVVEGGSKGGAYHKDFAVSVAPQSVPRIPVLIYHHILTREERYGSQYANNIITTTTEEFRRQRQLIRDNGYDVITVSELAEYVRGERVVQQKSVVITFDDGYRSNIYYAAPILREFGYKATLFTLVGRIEETADVPFAPLAQQHLTRHEISEFADAFDFESHTYRMHGDPLTNFSYEALLADFRRAQESLPSKYLSYPNGESGYAVVQAAMDAGFEAAFTTVTRGVRVGDDLFRLPRIYVTYPMDDAHFLYLLTL